MDFYREWCDVGTEDEPLADEERTAAEDEARRVCDEECDSMHGAPQTPAETKIPNGSRSERRDG
jgi:hypothetical protein